VGSTPTFGTILFATSNQEASVQRKNREPSLLGALLEGAKIASVQAGGCPVDAHTWLRAMGNRIASRCSPEQLRDGVLTVRVASSVWAQELSLLSSDIIARLNELGFSVQRIRCRVGELEKRSIAPKPSPRIVVPKVPLPSELTERLYAIKDDELRNTIAEAAQNHLSIRAWKAKERAYRPPTNLRANGAKQGVLAPRAAESQNAPRDQTGSGPREALRGTRGKTRD
jgi:Dna[CI] antecedent, DciA